MGRINFLFNYKMNEYESEYGEQIAINPTKKRSKGRPKQVGESKNWDIRLTPVDQVEVNWGALDISDFNFLLVCKEGEPNGTPRLHYHIYATTTRSDSYIDNLLSKIGKATEVVKGNAVFSKRKAHEHSIGYIVKNKNVVFKHNIPDQKITEFFKQSDDYRKEKERERKSASREKENFLAEILKSAEVKRLTDPSDITAWILEQYSKNKVRFPARSTIETAVLTLLYEHDPHKVIAFYCPKFFS